MLIHQETDEWIEWAKQKKAKTRCFSFINSNRQDRFLMSSVGCKIIFEEKKIGGKIKRRYKSMCPSYNLSSCPSINSKKSLNIGGLLLLEHESRCVKLSVANHFFFNFRQIFSCFGWLQLHQNFEKSTYRLDENHQFIRLN